MPLRAKAARKRSTLTQGHVATIIGHLSKGQISRMENGCRRPHPRFVVGTIILFHRGIDDLFQRLYQEVEDHIAREALRMWESLDGATSLLDQKRREVLADILSAIAARQNQKDV